MKNKFIFTILFLTAFLLTACSHNSNKIVEKNSDGTSTITYTDGSFVSKDSGGSYTMQLPSGENIILYSNGSYLISKTDGSSETGTNKEELNKYLISKDFTIFSELDKKVSDILEYIKKNN